MNNKWLGLILIFLIGIFIGSKLLKKNNDRSFESDFIQVDTAQLDKIIVHPKDVSGTEFSLTKIDDEWNVSQGEINTLAMGSKVNALMSTIAGIKATRVVAKSPDKWGTYDVDEEKGQRIELFENGKKTDEIILGRFDFNQQTRSAKSYIRHLDDDNVYVVDGFLSMTLGQAYDAYRNKIILNATAKNINSIDMTYGIDKIQLRKENYWVSASNQVVDSLVMDEYINTIANINGKNIIDNPQLSDQPAATLKVGQSNGQTTTISAFIGAETDFVLNSSSNPNTYFSSDSTGVYARIFNDLIEYINVVDN